MKRLINPKTIKKSLNKRKLQEESAMANAALMTDDQKNEVQATVLRELTSVCTNRIRLLEKVLGRKVKISTSAPMGSIIGEVGEEQLRDDDRMFRITVE